MSFWELFFKNKKKESKSERSSRSFLLKTEYLTLPFLTAFIPFQYNVSHGLGYPKYKSSLR